MVACAHVYVCVEPAALQSGAAFEAEAAELSSPVLRVDPRRVKSPFLTVWAEDWAHLEATGEEPAAPIPDSFAFL